MKLLKTCVNGLKLWYRSDDKFVGQRIALGKYEEYETKLLLSQLNKGSVAVDVGANIGYYTLLMAQKCKRVYAVEPEKESFEILKKNVKENKLNNVVLINKAAGDRNEQRAMINDKENFGNHRLSRDDGNEPGVMSHEIKKVKCIKLDDILKNEQKIDLIKSDTQGWEPAVIKGAMNFLKRDRPTLFLEYWPDGALAARQDLRFMIYELKKIYGENIWQIDDYLNIYKRVGGEINVNPKTGYADLWMKKRTTGIDLVRQFTNMRIKRLIRTIIGVR